MASLSRRARLRRSMRRLWIITDGSRSPSPPSAFGTWHWARLSHPPRLAATPVSPTSFPQTAAHTR